MTILTPTLAPAKFTSLAAELILVLVITYTLEENIYASLDWTTSKDSSDYLAAERSVLTCIALSVLMLVFMILTLFAGVSLFYDRVNMVQTCLNSMGVFWLCWYIHNDSPYNFLWAIWTVTILVPALIELMVLLRVRSVLTSKV